MKRLFGVGFAVVCLLFMEACNSNEKSTAPETAANTATHGISAEAVTYGTDSLPLQGYVAWDTALTGKRPIVIIIPEWWGLNDYIRSRARQLAALGYVAFAADFYGNGKMGNDPKTAGELAAPFYTNPQLAKSRFDAALEKAKSYPAADASKIAAIGYCFGGAQALNMARLGEDLKGVVSFHGNLAGVPVQKDLLKADILVCHGDIDQFVSKEEVANFKKQMDSVGAHYTFRVYPNATHGFTNPDATANGKKFNMSIAYNAAADSASWNEMKTFFKKIF